MISVPVKVKSALAAVLTLAAGMAGCGNELKDTPENAPYVAPPSPPEMQPPPKQKGGRPQIGVPLGFSPVPISAPAPADLA